MKNFELMCEKIYLRVLKEAKSSASVYKKDHVAFCYIDEGSVGKTGVAYRVDLLDYMLSAKQSGDPKYVEMELENMIVDSMVATVTIGKPATISASAGKCNGAWSISSVAGPGKLAYGMGYFMSPTGKLIPDRSSLTTKAKEAWIGVHTMTAGTKDEGETLDDQEHPDKGQDSFHDAHHTPDDDSDDCVTWSTYEVGPFAADALNRSYSLLQRSRKEYNFEKMIMTHEQFVNNLSKYGISPTDFEENMLFASSTFFMNNYPKESSHELSIQKHVSQDVA